METQLTNDEIASDGDGLDGALELKMVRNALDRQFAEEGRVQLEVILHRSRYEKIGMSFTVFLSSS